MLTAEQYQKVISHEAFNNMEHAIALASSQAQGTQLQHQLGEAMKLIEQQQATIVKQQATIEDKQAGADTLAKHLADISEFNEMTVEQMLAEVQRWRDEKASKAALPVLVEAVDTEGGAKD